MQETLGEGADLTPGVMDNESMDTRDESAEIASWEKFDSNGLVVSKKMDILPSHLQIAPQLTRGGDHCDTAPSVTRCHAPGPGHCDIPRDAEVGSQISQDSLSVISGNVRFLSESGTGPGVDIWPLIQCDEGL